MKANRPGRNADTRAMDNSPMAHTPDFIAPTRHTDPDAALAQVSLIYQQQIGHLREAMQRSSPQRANALLVRLELQADCYAGVWAYHAQHERQVLEPGDVEEAINAAQAVGDDRLQQQAQGYVVPDSFTHGTSAQRARWFETGFASGRPQVCDTFNATQL